MNESVAIYVLNYGGLFVAFFCLLFATINRKARIFRWLCFIGAFLALIFEGGCLEVLGGIGTATGGSDVGAAKMMVPVELAFFIALTWCLLLICLMPIKKDENNLQDKNLSESVDKTNQTDTR